MSDTSTTTNYVDMPLYGRREILVDDTSVDLGNVIRVLNEAYHYHEANRIETEYLYNYYRGCQPILGRTKERNKHINNKIVENRFAQIVDFKTGYLVGEPIQYTSRTSGAGISNAISELNGYMFSAGKAECDTDIADWQHICGVGYRMVLPSETDERPFDLYSLDPRESFVIRANSLGKKPIAGVYYITDSEKHRTYFVYTPTMYFEVREDKIIQVKDNPLGMIPIVEYPANKARMGVCENVLSILNAINNLDSNRLDGVEQFIQSLLIIYNADVKEDETASMIKQAGILLLRGHGENKADVKLLSEQLDQSQTQTLKQDLYSAVLEIVGMPAQGNGNTSDSSNNGAMILKNGWQSAEARAKKSETIFKQSEKETLRIVLHICEKMSGFALSVADIAIKFTRRNYEAITEKSTVLTTLLGSGYVEPVDAYTASGLFVDPEECARRGIEWHDENVRKAQNLMQKEDPADEPEGEDAEEE